MTAQAAFKFFDSDEGERRKSRGMSAAADRRRDILKTAQHIAFQIARENCGTANMDLVNQRLIASGIDISKLGNAAGSVFRSDEWEHIGWTISRKVSAHSRHIKEWRLRA